MFVFFGAWRQFEMHVLQNTCNVLKKAPILTEINVTEPVGLCQYYSTFGKYFLLGFLSKKGPRFLPQMTSLKGELLRRQVTFVQLSNERSTWDKPGIIRMRRVVLDFSDIFWTHLQVACSWCPFHCATLISKSQIPNQIIRKNRKKASQSYWLSTQFCLVSLNLLGKHCANKDLVFALAVDSKLSPQ